jgi:adenosylmethionine-8-amino-7-oxononanoate aminotransferase
MPTPSADQLREWDRTHVWHAFTQMAGYEPLLIERGRGCTLIDMDGREYLDGVSSLWCNVHGHGHPRLNAAITEQLAKIAHTTALGASNSTTVRLARRLAELAPAGLDHVFFSGDGSSAVEVALKMAFQYWRQCDPPEPQKDRYVALARAYHGDTLGSVSVGGVARFHAMFSPLLFDVLRVPAPDMYRLPDGVSAEEALDYYLQQAEDVLRPQHERIAALVIEPLVQGAAGIMVHPPGYLRGIRELTRKYNVLLIADEVAVGFGRTGSMFACQQEDVSPDFLCLAKGLTGGYLPMAATLATGRVWEAFLGDAAAHRQFFHGHTYAGNPLAAAVALASLDVFEEERTLEQMGPKAVRLAEHLQRIARLPNVGHTRSRGLMGGVELVRDKQTKEPFAADAQRGANICRRARGHGVLLRPLGDVIVAMPPLSVTIDELDCIMVAIEESIIAEFRTGDER